MPIPVKPNYVPGNPLPPTIQQRLKSLIASADLQARATGSGDYNPNLPTIPTLISGKGAQPTPAPGGVPTGPVQPSPRPVPAPAVAHTTKPVKKR